MTRVFVTTAALVAAVVVWAVSLPAAHIILPTPWEDRSVRGIMHVHSRASDGRGTLDEIAAAAARAGLAFVIITDHGDGTRRPEPPSYRSGVLVIDAVEISTSQGHYIGLGLGEAPYPLGGDARDVVEDVRRLGGFGIAAHPDSPKRELAWSDLEHADADGLELLNLDTTWRVHAFNRGPRSWARLAKALLAYPARPAESMTALLTDGRSLQADWAAQTRTRQVVAVAGADAHAKLAVRDAEPGDNRFSVPIPSYESSFRVLSVHVVPGQPFTGEAAHDASELLAGLRSGHVFVVVDGWASPARFLFTASTGGTEVGQGDALVATGALTLRARSNAPAGYVTTLFRDGAPLRVVTSTEAEFVVDSAPGVYTAEVSAPGRADGPAWITSNPIYVRRADPRPTATSPVATRTVALTLHDGRSTAGWTVEQDPTSIAAIDSVSLVDGPWVRLRYGLSGGVRMGQYAAAAVEVPRSGVPPFDALAFTLKGERPMRVSVQVRVEGQGEGAPGPRWQRSVYVDDTARDYVVSLADMRPVAGSGLGRVVAENVRSVMFVIDTTNTQPGRNGRLWIGSPVLAKGTGQTPSGANRQQ